MCQSKANGGRRCGGSNKLRHQLFSNASTVRAGMNAGDEESRQKLDMLHEESLKWRSLLTEDEEEELFSYQMTGYVTVNSYLRGKGEEGMDERSQKYIKNLDSALAKAPTGPERMVYRSVVLPEHLRDENKTKAENMKDWIDTTFVPGQTVTFPEYLSTTADSDLMVRNNEKRRKKGWHAVFEIVTTSGAVLHQNKDENSKVWSVQDDEKEILLGRVKTFKVEKVYRKVEFASTYKSGVDSFDGYYTDARQKATIPVIQLVEVK